MSTRAVIRDIAQLIKDLADVQTELKNELHRPHSRLTPAQMVEARDRRLKITACLNYLHLLKGHEGPATQYHQVADEDLAVYHQHFLWVSENSRPNLDPVPVELDPSSVAGLTVLFQHELNKAYQRIAAPAPVREHWWTRLLNAVGNALK